MSKGIGFTIILDIKENGPSRKKRIIKKTTRAINRTKKLNKAF
jgi:hypothetical protein